MPAAKAKPRTKPADQRREELMNAAQRLFLKQGIAPTTIDQITSGAEVAKGTFYLHFSSKEDVLLALRKRYVLDALAKVQAAVDACDDDDWTAKLAAWGKASIDGYLAQEPLHDMVFREFNAHKHEDHGGDQVLAYLAELLAGGNKSGAWSVDDPPFTANFLFNGLHGIVHGSSHGGKRVSKTQLIRKFQQVSRRLVGVPNA